MSSASKMVMEFRELFEPPSYKVLDVKMGAFWALKVEAKEVRKTRSTNGRRHR